MLVDRRGVEPLSRTISPRDFKHAYGRPVTVGHSEGHSVLGSSSCPPPVAHRQEPHCFLPELKSPGSGRSGTVDASVRERESRKRGVAAEADDVVAIWILDRLLKGPADQPLHAIAGSPVLSKPEAAR